MEATENEPHDEHVIDFTIEQGNSQTKHLSFPSTKASTELEKVDISGNSTAMGPVSLIVNNTNGKLKIHSITYPVVCDWSTFE